MGGPDGSIGRARGRRGGERYRSLYSWSLQIIEPLDANSVSEYGEEQAQGQQLARGCFAYECSGGGGLHTSSLFSFFMLSAVIYEVWGKG